MSLPSTRTWFSGATGPGSGSCCSCLLPVCLDLPLKAKRPPCSPLNPQWPSPAAVKASKAVREKRTIYSSRRAQERCRSCWLKARRPVQSSCTPSSLPVSSHNTDPESRHNLPCELTNVGDRNHTPHLCSASSCCSRPVRPGLAGAPGAGRPVVSGEHRSQWPQAQGYSWAGILFLLCKKELMIPAT